jgi:GNAT superfamily N-acetyltransferase
MTFEFVLTESPTAADRDAILVPLMAHNDAQFGPTEFKPLAILLKQPDGAVVGGLYARSGYDWLFIELLAVPEALRGRRVGTELMRRAEAVARERGCVGLRLDTYSFQAPDFYCKLGYEVFGVIDDHPRGHRRLFLRKYLKEHDPNQSGSD